MNKARGMMTDMTDFGQAEVENLFGVGPQSPMVLPLPSSPSRARHHDIDVTIALHVQQLPKVLRMIINLPKVCSVFRSFCHVLLWYIEV